jgi:hypothetical protein
VKESKLMNVFKSTFSNIKNNSTLQHGFFISQLKEKKKLLIGVFELLEGSSSAFKSPRTW